MHLVSNCIVPLFISILLVQFEPTSCQVNPDDNPEKWLDYAKQRIAKFEKSTDFKVQKSPKNVIVFVGDGMSIHTVTGARYLKAQLVNKSAGESQLVWDEWDSTSFVQTFSADRMTTDSGAAATALFSGAKGNHDTVGLTHGARCCKCYKLRDDQIPRSALQHAVDAGLSTGFVTTTTVTHATPGATYAGTQDRGWESKTHSYTEGGQTKFCKDIATQMIERAIDFNVIMGGGWKHFYSTPNVNTPQTAGGRLDSQNLLEKWFDIQKKKNRKFAMVYDKKDLMKVKASATDYLLGLFSSSHLKYDVERVEEPSLAEMVKVAIEIVSKNPKGYLLMVEGGRIDHGHHDNKAHYALTDTLAMEKAVQQAISQVNLNDTMIIVTADHAHTFGIVGYGSRKRNIFDTVDEVALDSKGYLISTYFNGPGASNNTPRRDPHNDIDRFKMDYRQQSLVPLKYSTHSAEDVALFATGPYSTLFHGSHDNTFVGHATMYSLCLGPYVNRTHCSKSRNSAYPLQMNNLTKWVPIAMLLFVVRSHL